MRKIRGLFASNGATVNAHALQAATNARKTSSNHRDANRSTIDDDPMGLIRPSWASFDMEPIFWRMLQHIGVLDSASCQEFESQAQARYPGIPKDAAVRIQIMAYFDKLSLEKIKESRPGTHTLHEPPAVRLYPSHTPSTGT